jgi:hypothetical protein
LSDHSALDRSTISTPNHADSLFSFLKFYFVFKHSEIKQGQKAIRCILKYKQTNILHPEKKNSWENDTKIFLQNISSSIGHLSALLAQNTVLLSYKICCKINNLEIRTKIKCFFNHCVDKIVSIIMTKKVKLAK